MSENVRFYQWKMAAQRAGRRQYGALTGRLREILAVVADCERRWALEEWIEKQI